MAEKHVTFEGTVSDAYDGASRLLFDAQRFGFGIRRLSLAAEPDGSAMIRIELTVDESLDVGVAVARMSRHPSITSLRSDYERLHGALALEAESS
jgi:hypothetical protein